MAVCESFAAQWSQCQTYKQAFTNEDTSFAASRGRWFLYLAGHFRGARGQIRSNRCLHLIDTAVIRRQCLVVILVLNQRCLSAAGSLCCHFWNKYLATVRSHVKSRDRATSSVVTHTSWQRADLGSLATFRERQLQLRPLLCRDRRGSARQHRELQSKRPVEDDVFSPAESEPHAGPDGDYRSMHLRSRQLVWGVCTLVKGACGRRVWRNGYDAPADTQRKLCTVESSRSGSRSWVFRQRVRARESLGRSLCSCTRRTTTN